MRQVENGYGSQGKGSGGKGSRSGVVTSRQNVGRQRKEERTPESRKERCDKCAKAKKIGTKIKNGQVVCGMHHHSQAPVHIQASTEVKSNRKVRVAQAAKGSEQVRRVNERSMTRIEKVDEEDDEEIVDFYRDVSRMGKQALRKNGQGSSSVRHKPRR